MVEELAMRRLVTVCGVSLMLMVPTVASAASNQTNLGRCVSEARHALGGTGVTFDVEQFANVTLGTNGDDIFGPQMTDGPDLVCGFGGNDSLGLPGTLGPGDVFVAGDGFNSVTDMSGGTFIGGDGADGISLYLRSGLFIGGAGDDHVGIMQGGTFDGGPGNETVGLYGGVFNGGLGDDQAAWIYGGTFNGGDGDDSVPVYMNGGTFNGGAGADSVATNIYVGAMNGGTFNGGAGPDFVRVMNGGTFDGGDGIDFVETYLGGTLISVP